jgi:hypothetical protein
VAERISERVGFAYYRCDDHFSRHLTLAADRGLPVSAKVRSVTHQYIFMRGHAENLSIPLDLYTEHFEFILEDLAGIAGPVVVEGCALLPRLLHEQGVAAEDAFYLVPTEHFQRSHYAKRTWAGDRLKETTDPAQAYETWMIRDASFARLVADQAKRFGYGCLWVDGGLSIDETVGKVIGRLGRGGAEGV